MISWTTLAWVVMLGSVTALLGVLAWLRFGGQRTEGGALAAVRPFLIERFLPMGRLLSEEDFVFLSRQPGYRPEIGARWKIERRRIFRLYLRELKCEFQRLHAQARMLVANSQADSAELVSVLLRQQVVFRLAMIRLEIRLALRAVGIGTVDIRALVELIEAMRLDLARLGAPLAA